MVRAFMHQFYTVEPEYYNKYYCCYHHWCFCTTPKHAVTATSTVSAATAAFTSVIQLLHLLYQMAKYG